MLEVQNLRMRYGRQEAVRDVSFQVAPGSVVSLIGQNGAGKSTTINMLCGILPPVAGTVRVNGELLTPDNLAARRQIGFVPDRPDVYEHLTAREYVRYVGGLYGLRRRAVDAAAEPLFARFRLMGREDDLLATYSHGMRQKAILVAALAHDPALLVLDEPIVGLDPVSARILLDVIAERARAGAAVLFSTHLLSIAAEVADRVVVIHGGRVCADGAVADLAARVGAAPPLDLEAIFFALIGESAVAR